MSMMTSQSFKFVDSTKKKTIDLENGTLFFLQIKSSLILHEGFNMAKISFLAEAIYKICVSKF